MADLSNAYLPEDIGTDAYGDLLFSAGGDLVMTSDVDVRGTSAVGQDVLMRLKTFLAEPFTNTSLGVPYYQQLLGQKAPASTWDAVLQAVVLQTPGVVQLTSWISRPDYARRSLTISFAAVTTTGPIVYNGSVDLNTGG